MARLEKLNLPKRANRRGQSTVEYLLMMTVGALFTLQIVRFFNDVFKDGLSGLETNIATEVRTGDGFGGGEGL